MELPPPTTSREHPTPDPKPDHQSLDHHDLETQQTHEANATTSFFDELDSTCSTPYVSAPSSPGRGSGPGPVNGGFYYSAPASPMHFALTNSYTVMMSPDNSSGGIGFEFGSGSGETGSSMSSADELFLNGKIRPMKLSTHLERPQVLTPLLDLEQVEEESEDMVVVSRGRDPRVARDKSVRRRTRSLSPLRNTFSRSTFSKWNTTPATNDINNDNEDIQVVEEEEEETTKEKQRQPKSASLEAEAEADVVGSLSACSSRSSSAGRSTSKRWVFLKDFLRSKSEGRSNNKYFWLPTKEKKHQQQSPQQQANISTTRSPLQSSSFTSTSTKVKKQPVHGIGAGKKRRVPPSPHELHYTANRAQAEEMKKKTFLPYKQGLLGCLGFSSKGYGAMNGFTRALNPVSSR